MARRWGGLRHPVYHRASVLSTPSFLFVFLGPVACAVCCVAPPSLLNWGLGALPTSRRRLLRVGRAPQFKRVCCPRAESVTRCLPGSKSFPGCFEGLRILCRDRDVGVRRRQVAVVLPSGRGRIRQVEVLRTPGEIPPIPQERPQPSVYHPSRLLI